MSDMTAPNAARWTPPGWPHDAAPVRHGGLAVPGVPNTHSHAFQRAMAGMAEVHSAGRDSFWTWRERMYAFAARLDPDSLRDVATQLYVEMLRAGYTRVCEFHYLHHAPDGRAYDDPAAMSRALLDAAARAGIGITLLPVLYMTGGFDGRALSERQRRFGHDVDAYLRLLSTLRRDVRDDVRVGVAFHSLRAVPEAAMREVFAALPDVGIDGPIHIHIAEQTAEVDECLAVRGARPVRWLLDHADVDMRWTLVHATHLDDAEVRDLAASGATVSLCPTTEANLGDGLFPLREYIDAGGRWSIGSDSHISVSPVEELRWLEYGQRLVTRQRNVGLRTPRAHVGASLLADALDGGYASCGLAAPADDWLALDADAPELAALVGDAAIDGWIFSGNRPRVREVFRAGRRVIADGEHAEGDAIAAAYVRTVRRLAAG